MSETNPRDGDPRVCSVCGTAYRRPSEARRCTHPVASPAAAVPAPVPVPSLAPLAMVIQPEATDSDEVAELKTTIKVLAQQLAAAQSR